MSENQERINQLLLVSKQIINDCCMENGGIVAANTTKDYYCRDAKNYFYIWPRDAAFAMIAGDFLGLYKMHDSFFNWCMAYAEGFKETGLFFENYHTNGLKARFHFQPDQTGFLLYSIWHHIRYWPEKKNKHENIVRLAANGICSVWIDNHFNVLTNDLWEERLCFPDLEDNFTYSLAACIRGLSCAVELFHDEKWRIVADEMKNQLDKHYLRFFVRSYGKIPDQHIDASVLGLVYPFDIYPANDVRIRNSVNEIERKLTVNGGVYRYESDQYDGWMYEGKQRNKGAGAWPVLNFWLSIYFSVTGDVKKAAKYYYWVLQKLNPDGYIPEQLFQNPYQKSVSPLLWSHAMFVLATEKLGLLRDVTD